LRQGEQRGSAKLAFKAGFWYVISTFLVRSLSFITTPIFSRLLSKADYGEFSNFASWQALLIIITGMELHSSIGRAYYDFKEDFDQYISSLAVAGCGITLLFYVLFLVSGDWIFRIVSIPPEYVHILFFLLLSLCWKQIFIARERTLYRYKTVAAMSIVNLLIPTLVAVALVILAPQAQRLSARIYGFYVPSALVGIGCGIVVLLKGKQFRFKYLRYALVLSLPLMVHYLTTYFLTSSNTIVTKLVLGPEAVSVVSIASSTIHILTLFVQAVSGAITTWLMDNLEQQNTPAIRKGAVIYTLGIGVISVGVMLLAPEVIWILGGKQYGESILLMPGMVTAVMIQSVTTLFTITLTFRKKVLLTAVFTGIVSVLSVGAKCFLLPHIGIQGLPYINIVAFAALFFINCILVRKYGFTKQFNYPAIFGIIGCVMVIMVLVQFLYNHLILRYCIIGACGILALAIAVIKRREIKKLITSFRKK